MKTTKVCMVVFAISFSAMLTSLVFGSSPTMFKILDTIAVSGFVGLFAVGTIACAYALNDADWTAMKPESAFMLRALAKMSGIFAGVMSLGFLVVTIMRHGQLERPSHADYYWVLALIAGTTFFFLSKKLTKRLAKKSAQVAC